PLQGRGALAGIQAGDRGIGDRAVPRRDATGEEPPGRRPGRPPDLAAGAGLPVHQLPVPRDGQPDRGPHRGRRHHPHGAADFGAVAFILRETRVILERARELIPEHRQALEALPTRLSQREALSQLIQSLDEATVHPTEEELSELFQELRADALVTLIGWL